MEIRLFTALFVKSLQRTFNPHYLFFYWGK